MAWCEMYAFTQLLDDGTVEWMGSSKWSKGHIIRYVRQRFTCGIDYKEVSNPKGGWGGNNRKDYVFTESAMALLRASYKLRSVKLAASRHDIMVSPVLMPLETGTLGIIHLTFKDVTTLMPQFKCGPYYVDMYMPEFGICVECDEMDHMDRPIREETAHRILHRAGTWSRIREVQPHVEHHRHTGGDWAHRVVHAGQEAQTRMMNMHTSTTSTWGWGVDGSIVAAGVDGAVL